MLIVDDSPETVGFATAALEGAGYRVLASLSGERAIAIAHETRPDLVLLDALMPDLDGFETLLRLRRMPGLAAMPVIFMTGLGDVDHVVRGLGSGAVDYLTKPVDAREMLARIAVHIAGARLTASARAAIELAGHDLLAVDADGLVRWATARAELLLPGGRLQEAACSALLGENADEAAFGFESEAGVSVEVSRIGRLGPSEILLRIVERRHSRDEIVLRERLGVTAREAEVLIWLTRGKTNRDIADVLGLSPRTVNKHLEQIYNKMGIENRASAVARTLLVLRR